MKALYAFWSWLKSFFFKEPEIYRYIGHEKVSVYWSDLKISENIFYYFYESNYGNRKCEIKEQGYCDLYEEGKNHPYYLEYIYPWLQGKAQYAGKPQLRVIK